MSWPDPLPRPYPPVSYRAEDGEASAWLRRDAAPADVTYRSGGTCEYLATGDRTQGRFGLYRWTFGEGESGPDPHFHRTISEQFYVLAGEVRLFDGRAWVTAGAGDYLYVPEGGIHGFRGSGGAAMLLMFAPGGPREDYFETLARGLETDEAERARFMATHDTYWLSSSTAAGRRPARSRGPGAARRSPGGWSTRPRTWRTVRRVRMVDRHGTDSKRRRLRRR